MIKIAIASGKGGTGKTTLAVNWSKILAEKYKVILYDLDVEEPDCHIFLRIDNMDTVILTGGIPKVDKKLCTYCGLCSQKCEFNAIAVTGGLFQLFPELCHSCGRCINICPENALFEVDDRLGEVGFSSDGKLEFIHGKLDVGILQTKSLIHKVKKQLPRKMPSPDIIIYDCPPGNTCPTVEAVKDADYAVLVTEPSPFGQHDLSISVRMVRQMGLDVGVVINRSSEFDKIIEDYCKESQVTIFGRLPFSMEAAKLCSKGELLLSLPIYPKEINKISQHVFNKAQEV